MVDGVRPSNVDQGYILRRLIRRLVRHLRKLEIDFNELEVIANTMIDSINNMYPELNDCREVIVKKNY